MLSTISQSANYRVKVNHASLSDSLFFGSQGENNQIDFYSMDYWRSFLSTVGLFNSYLTIVISLDQQINQYQRTVYSFLDMFGFVGGIYELMKIIGNFIIQFFIVREFYSTLLKKLFNRKENYTIQMKRSSKQKYVGISFKSTPNPAADEFRKKSEILPAIQHEEEKVHSDLKEYIQEEEKSNVGFGPPEGNSIQLIKNDINEGNDRIKLEMSNNEGKSMFKYSFKDIIYEFFCLHKLKFKNK